MTPSHRSERARERARAIAARLGREPHDDDWAPHAGPQERFLRLSVFEALYGGAAGGGKSDALLVDAIYNVGRGYGANYQALVLRRTFPELETSLIPRAAELYPRLGGVARDGGFEWRFPQGERVYFGHCQYTHDVHRYQGAAFQRVLFDELTSFEEYQYTYLLSRIRSAHGVPCGVRAASNPGGGGHQWVRRRFGPWVSRRHPRPAAPGEIRYFVRTPDSEREADRTEPGALGRTFIPAKLEDNPTLCENDPEYRFRLQALNRLENLQLEHGDWDAEPARKDYYDRARVRVLRERPHAQDVWARCRAWDFGASANGDPSVALLGCWLHSGLFVVEHVARGQWQPDQLHAQFELWSAADKVFDPRVVQSIPEDPGAAGKLSVADFQQRYKSIAIEAVRPSKDKTTRFRPASSRALAGNFAIVDDGSWDVEAYHAELEAFPLGKNDDQVDATSDCYSVVTARAGNRSSASPGTNPMDQ